MAELPPDEAFAQQLLKAGLVTDAQIKAALQAQAQSALKGQNLPLGKILVQQGLVTAAQHENFEKTLDSRREEAKRLGPYRIIKKLGEGGMGAVYLAEDPANGQKVALKVLPKVAAREEDAVRRFLREVDSARKLDHPNIVRAGASGEDKGLHYFVMEYVEGETLGARLKREEFLSPDQAAKVVLQIAYGLKYAHEQGYIHRDIKPDNVVMSREGVVKILDMGLSKNIDEAQSFRTVTGVALGTPHYIAPEQARGDKGIDGRADIYSLGATYYHLVTGETPFHGTTAIEIIAQHLHKQLPDPRDIRDGIPDGVVHIIRRMMAKKSKDRYRDCAELLADLELVVGGRNPSSQALDAAHSAVALPMAREARERFRAQRRGQRPGTYRATTKSRSSAAPLVVCGIGAVMLVIVLAVAMGGSGSRPVEPPPVTAKETRPEVPRPREPEHRPVEPAPRAKTREELRGEEAQRKLDEIKAQAGRFAEDENRRRYGEFAKEYADTAPGKTIAGWLRDTEPKVAEIPKHEIPKPEVPKPAEPPPPQPVVKPPEPPPAEPVVKPPPPAPARPAVPDAAKLREAEAAVRKNFPIDQAKTAKDKTDLARTLLTTASTSGAKDAEFYVLLRMAKDFAAQGMDVKTALEAIDARAAAFDVDAMAEKVDLFAKASAKGADAAAWAGAALDVAEEASEGDEYEAAVKLAARAEALARAANDRGIQEAAKAQSNDLADLKRVADGLKGHFKTLQTNPDDPTANATVGKFVCLVKGDWKRGLPMLAKCSEPAFKNLAEQELANPTDAAAQAALGEAWAAWAEKETPTYKAHARGRAAKWLGRAIAGLTGPAKVLAERKLTLLVPAAGNKGSLTLYLRGGVRMEFVYVKPGVFTMGGTQVRNEDWQVDERPEHKVTITKGYYLGKYEVTRGQFAAFVKATNYKTDAEKEGKAWGTAADGAWVEIPGLNWRKPNSTQTDDHPVMCVSWNDAKVFCEWAANKMGRGIRLPTEAEWEYACRAGTKTRWSFGDDAQVRDDYGWYDGWWQTHPVGQKKPNAWGLYDMHGNVWEWCQDWAGPYAEAAVADPTGPAGGDRRCLRGGNFLRHGSDGCSPDRVRYIPSRRDTSTGFRVAVP